MPGPGYKYDKAADGDSQGSERGEPGAASSAASSSAAASSAAAAGSSSPGESSTRAPAPPTRAVHGAVAIDVACVFLASLPFLVLEINVVDPFQRGFFCGDETIDYPYEKSETVSDGLLIAGGFLIALATVIGGELCAACCLGHRCPPVLKRGGSLPGALYRTLGAFLFGCAVNQSLTDVAKFSVGRLRPHFLDVCKPDRALYNCSEGYITRVVCTGDPAVITEARKSFFSGHASFAMYSMVFLALYVESRLRWRGARILRPLLQFVLLLVAVLVGLSRLSDYRHHWSDVLVGFGSGATVAFTVVFLISGLFTDNCLAVHKRREAARTNGDLEQGQAANHNGHADAAATATATAAAIRCSAQSGERQATPPEPAVSE
ncbi:unnamed protein product [Lampetra planeri]